MPMFSSRNDVGRTTRNCKHAAVAARTGEKSGTGEVPGDATPRGHRFLFEGQPRGCGVTPTFSGFGRYEYLPRILFVDSRTETSVCGDLPIPIFTEITACIQVFHTNDESMRCSRGKLRSGRNSERIKLRIGEAKWRGSETNTANKSLSKCLARSFEGFPYFEDLRSGNSVWTEDVAGVIRFRGNLSIEVWEIRHFRKGLFKAQWHSSGSLSVVTK